MFSYDHNYLGKLYIVKAKCLSKYARKSLRSPLFTVHNNEEGDFIGLTSEYLGEEYDWGLVKITEDFGDKVKGMVYLLDVHCCYQYGNLVSEEIIEKEDLVLLNWPMVMYLYNVLGWDWLVDSYLRYLEIFSTGRSGITSDWAIRDFKTDKVLKEFKDREDYDENYVPWMIKQVETQMNINQIETELENKFPKLYNNNYHVSSRS